MIGQLRILIFGYRLVIVHESLKFWRCEGPCLWFVTTNQTKWKAHACYRASKLHNSRAKHPAPNRLWIIFCDTTGDTSGIFRGPCACSVLNEKRPTTTYYLVTHLTPHQILWSGGSPPSENTNESVNQANVDKATTTPVLIFGNDRVLVRTTRIAWRCARIRGSCQLFTLFFQQQHDPAHPRVGAFSMVVCCFSSGKKHYVHNGVHARNYNLHGVIARLGSLSK